MLPNPKNPILMATPFLEPVINSNGLPKFEAFVRPGHALPE